MYEGNIEARSRNHSCLRKAISVADSLYLAVALVIQHEERMRRITVSCVAFPAIPHFSTLSDKRHDFRGGVIELKCVF